MEENETSEVKTEEEEKNNQPSKKKMDCKKKLQFSG